MHWSCCTLHVHTSRWANSVWLMSIMNYAHYTTLDYLSTPSSHILSYIQLNMSPRFEWQSVISQSACTDETHNSFDQEFHLTVHNHFLLSILAYQRGQLYCTWGREKNIPVSYFCGRSMACHGNTLIQLGQSLFQAILSYIQEKKN